MELEGGVGLPYYISLDPLTGEELVEFNRPDRALRDKETFRAFLLEGVDKAAPRVARDTR